MVTIRESAEAFVEKIKKDKYCKLNKQSVENIIAGDETYTFLQQKVDLELPISDKNAAADISCAADASIRSYRRSNITAMNIYKEYFEYLKKQYGLQIDCNFPEWIPKTSLERQIYIAKLLHDPEMQLSKLEDILFVSGDTIENDLKKLRDEDDPLEVMGQKLTVEFDKRRRKDAFSSTLHPLFLTFNLTQIITMLEGLRMMSDNSAHRAYAIYAAKTIWAQLSEYAKKRIDIVSTGLGIDMTWYRQLDSEDSNLFYSEARCTSTGRNSILECYKNGKPCYIEYLEENDGQNGAHIFYSNCRITSFRDNKLIIKTDGGEAIELNSDRVVKAAVAKDEMFS